RPASSSIFGGSSKPCIGFEPQPSETTMPTNTRRRALMQASDWTTMTALEFDGGKSPVRSVKSNARLVLVLHSGGCARSRILCGFLPDAFAFCRVGGGRTEDANLVTKQRLRLRDHRGQYGRDRRRAHRAATPAAA